MITRVVLITLYVLTGILKSAQIYIQSQFSTSLKGKNKLHWHFCTKVLNKYLNITIFTFNKHFDKENDCLYEPVITKPHHWRKLFITFYIVNFLLFKHENLTYLIMKQIVTCVAKYIDILLTIDDCSQFNLVS